MVYSLVLSWTQFDVLKKSLKGHARRVFQAIVTNEHAEGKPRKAETLIRWNRDAIQRGLFEQHIDREICTISSKGRPRVETLNKDLLPADQMNDWWELRRETHTHDKTPVRLFVIDKAGSAAALDQSYEITKGDAS